jgi:hypothetical protein
MSNMTDDAREPSEGLAVALPAIAQTLVIGVPQTRLLVTAMAAQQAATDRVRAVLDTLVVGREELDGLVLLAVDADEGQLHFGRPDDGVGHGG